MLRTLLTKPWKLFSQCRSFPFYSTAAASTMSTTRFLADTDFPICQLEVKKHFESLSEKEQQYAHFIGRASWAGARAISASISEESPILLELILNLFTEPSSATTTTPKLRSGLSDIQARAGVSEESWKLFLEYVGQVLNNLGNYKSFGDTKFVPRLPVSDFEAIVKAFQSEAAVKLFEQVSARIYATEPEAQLLRGFPGEGHVSGYYSHDITQADAAKVQALLEAKDISALNTRLMKKSDGSFEVRVASGESKDSLSFEADDLKINVVFGDLNEYMARAADNIRSAKAFAANETQEKMLEHYERSFRTGSIDEHKESQRYWIRDIGPSVESNIGYVETYTDPAGVRAEWEGFVAVVNREMTEKFGKLVDNAEKYVGQLPWAKEFEKDVFNKPDFTSLEVVTFASAGGPPAGINIPNYDDIRMQEGFKNVSLGNVLTAKAPNEKITFLRSEDIQLFERYRGPAFEVQVGLHELLGHGSGKLLQEDAPGKFNFDHSNPPISPITGKPVTSWYKPGETWGSVFKAASNSFEECRAESVAMYLCVDREILSLFGHADETEAADIIYVCYLQMARAGLLALEFYDPKAAKWGQAHMQARYAILQVFLKAGIVTIEKTDDDLIIHLDRSKIETVGVKAVGDFLQKLQVYKATADAENGLAFYKDITTVSQQWLNFREIVMSKKQPRKVLVQGNTFLQDGTVIFKEYPSNLLGLIESYVERKL